VTLGRKLRLIYHALASYDVIFCIVIAALVTVGVIAFRWLVLDHDIQWWEWPFSYVCALIGSVGMVLVVNWWERRRRNK
jgi:predicted tellurium resistance membrane protein TerC